MKELIFIVVCVLVLVALISYGWWAYNRIVKLTTSIEEAWSSITISLKRRHDLVRQVAANVKHSQDYELQIQASVSALRAGDITKLNNAEHSINQTILGLEESYADLKAGKLYQNLFETLVDTENDIQGNRLLFNRSVALYCKYIRLFPLNIVATIFGYVAIDYFELDPVSSNRLPERHTRKP